MAATTSNVPPRRNGFDFAALSASAGKQDSAEELARLRVAVETLSEMVIAHGVMDARTLESIVGDLIQTPMAAVSLSAPLPPPAPSAAEAILKGGVPRPAAVAARPAPAPAPIAARPAPAPVAAKPAPAPVPIAVAAPVLIAAAPAPAPVAAKPAPAPMAARPAPAPVAAKPAPAPAVAQAAPAPAPVAAAPAPVAAKPAPAPVVAQPVAAAPASEPLVMAPPLAPVVASPFPASPAPQPIARRNPFDVSRVDAARIEAELVEQSQPPPGFFSRLIGRGKTSPSAVAKSASMVEFTERLPKLPYEGLYGDQQNATELSFPPPSTRRPRAASPAAAPRAKATRPASTAPARFCDRCWRRMDMSGACKTCSPSA